MNINHSQVKSSVHYVIHVNIKCTYSLLKYYQNSIHLLEFATIKI